MVTHRANLNAAPELFPAWSQNQAGYLKASSIPTDAAANGWK
jgi:hypothetical protein